DAQLVATPAREDLRDAIGGQRREQPPDVVLDHLGRALGWLLSPQSLDQAIRRHRAIGLESEHGQDRALLRAADRGRTVGDAGLEVAKDAYLHGAALVVVLAQRQPNHLLKTRSTATGATSH